MMPSIRFRRSFVSVMRELPLPSSVPMDMRPTRGEGIPSITRQ
jgi:hypothetical protein